MKAGLRRPDYRKPYYRWNTRVLRGLTKEIILGQGICNVEPHEMS